MKPARWKMKNRGKVKLICGTVEGCSIMNASRDTEYRDKVNESFI